MSSPLAHDGLPPLRDVIDLHGLSAKKSLGQNFILDLNLTAKIAALTGPLDGRWVIEVGPGPGGLTRALLEGGARVIAVERDERCLSALEQISDHWPGRLTVHSGDALDLDWAKVLATHLTAANEKATVIANLPYGIATKLLVNWLETEPWPPWFDGMALMFQREVANRIVAEPSTKPFGRLSVIAQWRCCCELALSLGPEVFTPAPKVASAVVRFAPRIDIEPRCDVAQLGQVSRAIFGQRRKMLRVTLKPLFRNPEKSLTDIGIDPSLRGEALSVTQIASIAVAMNQLGA